MSSQQPENGAADVNAFELIAAKLAQYGQNASNNISDGFAKMSIQNWIRMVIVVGGYMLLRPYIIKLSTKIAVRNLEKQEEAEKKAKEEAAKMSPNDIRGQKALLEDDIDADERADGTSADWGSKARVRQRKFLRTMLEAEEQRRLDEEDDADIKDLLVD